MMGFKIKQKIVVFLFICIGFLYYIEASTLKKKGDYKIDRWGISHGFTLDTVNSIVQTKDGYLWISTRQGLFRFDGVEFEKIPINGSWNYFAGVLFVDSKDTLWINSRFGLIKYKNGKTEIVKLSDGRRLFKVYSFLEDKEGFLWFGTDFIIYKYKNNKFTTFKCNFVVFDLLEDSNGNVWASGWKQGAFLLKNGVFENYDILENKKYNVYTVFESKEGTFWIATDKGLLKIDHPLNKTKKKVHLITPGKGSITTPINAIYEDKKNNIWIGSGDRLNKITIDKNKNILIEDSYKGSPVICVFEDSESSLWFGTFSKGLMRLRKKLFNTLYSDNMFIMTYSPSLYTSNEGDVWFGGNMGRIAHRKAGVIHKIVMKELSEEYGIRAIGQDGKNRFWFGTRANGLYLYENNKLITMSSRPENEPSDSIMSIFYDKKKDILWVGTIYGLKSFKNNRFNIYHPQNSGLHHFWIFQVIVDKRGDLWVCSRGGLSYFKNSIINETGLNFLNKNRVISIYEDRQEENTFWIGTLDKGLIKFKDFKSKTILKKDGLGSNSIYQILKDNRGNFWISSPDGVLKVSKNDLNDFFDGKKKSVNCITFGVSDGIDNANCSYVGANSATKGVDGRLYFSTRNGIAVVDPEDAKINKRVPNIVFKSIKINGELYDVNSKRNDFYGFKNITFDFAALSFLSPERIKYKTTLKGYDKKWIKIKSGQKRSVFYKNLPFGKYTFLVKASNSSGVWNIKDLSFTFSVKPFFYQTLLFKIIFIFLIILLFLISYFIIKKYKYFKQVENRYKNSNLEELFIKKNLDLLKDLFEEKKVYQDENLTLLSLSKEMDIQPKILSQIINENLNKNFNDFVNTFRIEEAKERLLDIENTGESVLDICFDVGFNSKSSFYRAFKKFTGKSPIEYKKSK